MTQRTYGMGYGMVAMGAREADPIQSFEEAGWAPNRRHRWGRRHRLDHGTRRRRGGGRHGNIAAGRQVDQSLPHHDLLLRGPRRGLASRRTRRPCKAHGRPRARRAWLEHLDHARRHRLRRAGRQRSRAVRAADGCLPGTLDAGSAHLLLHHRGRLEAAGRPGRAGGRHVRRQLRRMRRSGPDRPVRSHPQEGSTQRAAGRVLGLGATRVFGRAR